MEERGTAVNLSSLDFWRQSLADREAGFRWLRENAPLAYQPQAEGGLMAPEEGSGGYWAAVRYDDIRAVSRDAEHFISGRGVMLEDVPPIILDAAQSFLAMDAPRHRLLRGLVSAAFTPRQVAHLEAGIQADARTIVADLAASGETGGDFVERVAKRLPLMTIMRMLGVPEDDREEVAHHADMMVSWNDPDALAGREPLELLSEAIIALHVKCGELVEQRRADPGDDLLSALVAAEVDGERLEDDDICSFFVLLSVAGNDTTRHTTSHAMLALTDWPGERRRLLADLDGSLEVAVEEFVRWASPVMTFRRTVATPTVLCGQELAEGEKVVLFYPSGNRDERAFTEPLRFDVARQPNRHLGFGGGGPHYCLGAALAKLQLRILFGELLRRFPELAVSDPQLIVGNFVNGIARMAMDLGPVAVEAGR